MPSKNTTPTLYAALALAIKSSKKLMFKRTREGMPPRNAADKFVIDITNRLGVILPYDEDKPTEARQSAALKPDKAADEGKAGWQQIEEWSKEICKVGDEAETVAFLLLMSEINRANASALRVDNITTSAMQAGFAGSDLAWGARKDAVEKLRIEAGLSSEPSGDDDSVTAALEEHDHVDVTLPNGKELRLYGDAADMAKEPPIGSQRTLRAVLELLHNPETPQNLFEAVAAFVCEQSNEAGLSGILHREPVLIEILKTVKPENTHGAVCARVEAEFGGEKEAQS